MPTLRRLLDLLAPQRARIVLAAAFALGVGALSAAALGALVPILDLLFLGDGVARATGKLARLGDAGRALAEWTERTAQDDRVRALAIVLAGLLVLTLLRGALSFAQEVMSASIAERARLALAGRLFDRLTEHDESTLARAGLGNLTARFTYDLDMTGKALETLIGTIPVEGFQALAYLAFAVALSWKLTLLAAVLAPGILLLTRFLGRRIRRSAEGMLEKRAALLTRVQETVAAMPVVQDRKSNTSELQSLRHLVCRLL